jgi:cytochrome c5
MTTLPILLSTALAAALCLPTAAVGATAPGSSRGLLGVPCQRARRRSLDRARATACVALLACAALPGWAAADTPAPPREPAAIVKGTCILCHGPGIGGAPKFGDARAWEKRRERGLDTLVRTAENGKGAMPPRGGVPDLSPEELRATVAYLSGLAPR